jgi:hypothetical protein
MTLQYLDFFGQELNIGDAVIYGTTMSQGRGFNLGEVIKFTPKKVTVRNILEPSWNGEPVENSVYPQELLKAEQEQVTLFLLKRNPND